MITAMEVFTCDPFLDRLAIGQAFMFRSVCKSMKHIVSSRGVMTASPSETTLTYARFVAQLAKANPAFVLTLRAEEREERKMHLGNFRYLSRFSVVTLSVQEAFFLGVVIADLDCTVRLSDGLKLRNIKPIRERADAGLPQKIRSYQPLKWVPSVSVADAACLFGAASQNMSNLSVWNLEGGFFASFVDHPILGDAIREVRRRRLTGGECAF